MGTYARAVAQTEVRLGWRGWAVQIAPLLAVSVVLRIVGGGIPGPALGLFMLPGYLIAAADGARFRLRLSPDVVEARQLLRGTWRVPRAEVEAVTGGWTSGYRLVVAGQRRSLQLRWSPEVRETLQAHGLVA